MSTEWSLRITIICPEAMIDDANQLALVVGQSASDAETYSTAGWQDADGNRYAVASTLARPSFLTASSRQLVAPEFAPDADLVAAGRAQAALRVSPPDSAVASPSELVAVINASAKDAVAAAGLTPIPAVI